VHTKVTPASELVSVQNAPLFSFNNLRRGTSSVDCDLTSTLNHAVFSH